MTTVDTDELSPVESDGNAKSLVIAFSESPSLRETLTVLLERDCRLRFLDPHVETPADLVEPDLALIAGSSSVHLLPRLVRRWPFLPVVAVDLSDRGASTRRSTGVPWNVQTVSLEPEAIRAAVLQQIPAAADAEIRAAVRSVVGALQNELAYGFNALRSFVGLQSTDAGTDAFAILGAVTTEQCHAIAESLQYLYDYLARPRVAEATGGFVVAVCHHLEAPQSMAAQRGLRCACTLEGPTTHLAGPVNLAPLLASFVHAHLRRRAESPVIDVRATSRGITMRYRPRSASSSSPSWPLLLASLLLRPCSWRMFITRMNDDELLNLRPHPEWAFNI